VESRAKVRPLLCELHAHSTWSDGAHTVAELVDIYGRNGFDVLAVTDHILPENDRWRLEQERRGEPVSVSAARWDQYVRELEWEAWRARVRYDLLLIPGAELTVNHEDPDRAAHAVAVGLREHVEVGGDFVGALRTARAAGAGLIAAHPHGGDSLDPARTTRRFWRELDRMRPHVDRFELFNRNDL
jgi:predicted metal-dependent phosphoesterase TrpH